MEGENRDKRKILLLTVGLHAILILIMSLIIAWQPTIPPPPEIGIELGFALESPTSELQQETNDSPGEELTKEVETVANSTNPIDSDVDEELETAVADSPHLVEEILKKETEDSEETDQIENEIVDEPNQEKTEQRQVDERALYKPSNSTSNLASQGASLDFNGWLWDTKPNPDDKSSEEGKIVFEITVDDLGEVIGVRTIEKTISPVLEQVYRNAVLELTFSPTADNLNIAAQSTGRITFVIQSK